MENEVEQFHAKQFRRIGMPDAYNDELRIKMTSGEQKILHLYKKEFDGDKVEALIHLQKYPALDAFEIKKFDLGVQKAGQESKIAQTFYIGETRKVYDNSGKQTYRQNRYTLKEGYNLLSGRPVFKRLVSKEGQSFEAWVMLNLKNKLTNGNHETLFFSKNYGYNLENVLKEYPIKELNNIKYMVRLMESLHRGNLQSATFIPKDNTEERLFISPNIKMGSLHVYDKNKKTISTDQLVERNLISREQGQKLMQMENVIQQQKKSLSKDNRQKQKIG